MDAEIESMKEVGRFKEAVKYLLEPLLKHRNVTKMPCKHGRTFEMARQARAEFFNEIGEDYLDDEGESEAMQMPKGYCDCGPFNRRDELWEIAEIVRKAQSHATADERDCCDHHGSHD